MYDDMQPDNNQIGSDFDRGGDREGAMAKADLYKLANYSLKLFKKLQDDDQLEGWVQAKITKAADYVASVYHYLEYEMKISEYGEQLNNAEMMSEGRKELIKNKLMEAKAKVAELKKLQAEKLKKDKKEKKVDEAKSCNHTHEGTECPAHGMKECGGMEEGFDDDAKVGDTFKTQHGTSTKTKTGLVHKRDAKPEDDEDYVPPKKPSKAAKTAAEKKADKEKEIKLPKPAKGTRVYGIKNGERFEKTVKEAAKPDFLDMDKDGDKKEPMKKAVKDKEKKTDEALDMNLLKASQGAMSKNKKDKESDDNVRKPYGYRGADGSESDDDVAKAKSKKKSKKVDEVAEWKAKAVSLRESLEAMVSKKEVSEDQDIEEMMAMAAEIDAEGLAEASKDPAKLDEFLQSMFAVQEEQTDEEGPADLLAAVEEEINNPGRTVDNLRDVMNATFGADRSPEFKKARAVIEKYLDLVDNADVDHYDDDNDDRSVPAIGRMTHGDIARHIREYDLTDYLNHAAAMLDKIVGGGMATQPGTINESTEFDRLKQFLTRLNG